jgi:hypothetical protein
MSFALTSLFCFPSRSFFMAHELNIHIYDANPMPMLGWVLYKCLALFSITMMKSAMQVQEMQQEEEEDGTGGLDDELDDTASVIVWLITYRTNPESEEATNDGR